MVSAKTDSYNRTSMVSAKTRLWPGDLDVPSKTLFSGNDYRTEQIDRSKAVTPRRHHQSALSNPLATYVPASAPWRHPRIQL